MAHLTIGLQLIQFFYTDNQFCLKIVFIPKIISDFISQIRFWFLILDIELWMNRRLKIF